MSTLSLANASFALPTHDDLYMQLGDELRDLVADRLDAMEEIALAPKAAPAIRAIVQRRAGKKGWALSTLRSLYYDFIRCGDWKALLDKAAAGPLYYQVIGDADITAEFKTYLGQEWCLRQRKKFRAVWLDLVHRLKLWERGDAKSAIPGYKEPPPRRSDTGLPNGWTYENLLRHADKAADVYSRLLISQGPRASARLAPKRITSRFDDETGQALPVGRFFLFDDLWYDFRCLHGGKGSRLLSLHALELASACDVLQGNKPTIEDERGVEERLKSHEMVLLGAALLSTIGFHPQGTVFVCEGRTATFTTEIEELLGQLTGDKIKVDRGPMGGAMGIAGMMAQWSGGNPNHKAPLESFFNLLHNRTDHMLEFPGQLGSNSRLNCPEGTMRMEAHDEALAKAIQVFTPERRQRALFNLLDSREAMAMVNARVEFCNTRREHKIEGWAKCGNYIPSFRLDERLEWLPWTMIERLSPAQQEQLKLMLSANPRLTGRINMTPREVFERGRAGLKRFTPAQTALLLARTEKREISARQGRIAVPVPEVDADEELLFGPMWRDGKGREEAIRPDDKFGVIVNPFDARAAFLYRANGAFVGFAPVIHGGFRDDAAKNERQYNENAKAVSQWVNQAKQLAAPATRRAARIARNNAGLIREHTNEHNNLAAAADAALQAANAE